MNAQTAYQFLKPSLEQLTERQKEKLCELISGKPKKTKRKYDPVPTVKEYEKRLLETIFKH